MVFSEPKSKVTSGDTQLSVGKGKVGPLRRGFLNWLYDFIKATAIPPDTEAEGGEIRDNSFPMFHLLICLCRILCRILQEAIRQGKLGNSVCELPA